MACRLSPSGTRLVTIGATDWLQLWDVERGQLLVEMKAAQNGPSEPAIHQRIAWSGDGKYLAAIDFQGDVQLLDAATGKIVSTQTGENVSGAQRLIFGPDHKTLLVARRGKMPAIDVTTGKTLREFDIGENTPTHLVLRRGGTILDAFSGRSGHFRWRWADAVFEDQGRATYLDYFSPGEFHVDGTYFNGDSRIINYRTDPDTLHQITTNDKKVSALARSADNQLIAAGHEDGEVTMWTTKDKTLTTRWQALPGEVNFISLSQDGEIAAVASRSSNPANMSANRVTLWKRQGAQYQELFPDQDHKAGINWLFFSNDQRRLISASGDHMLGIWDLDKRERIVSLEYHGRTTYSPATNCVSLYRVNPNGRHIQLHDFSDPQQVKMLADFEGSPDNALSPDGKTLATCTIVKLDGTNRRPTTLTLYDVQGKAPARQIEVGNWNFYTVQWSPNSEMLVTGNGGMIVVWDAQSGAKLLQADSNVGPHVLGFSSDSKLLFGFVDDGRQLQKSQFLVYDIATQKRVHQIVLPSRCFSIAACKDARRVLLGCEDGTLRVYDLATAKLMKEISLHSHSIRAIALSSDERQFATGHDDSAIFLWDAKLLPTLDN